MIPGQCVIEADIRLPIGAEKDTVMREIRKILERYPQVSLKKSTMQPQAGVILVAR